MAAATLRKTAANAAEITYQVGDPDGIYRVEGWYRTDDFRVHDTVAKAVGNCPKTATLTFAKQITVGGRRIALKRVTVLDCLHDTTGDHGRTEFAVGADGSAELTREDTFSHHRQRMIEALDELKERMRRNERRQRLILALLILLILLVLWSTLGPLFL